MVTGVGLVFITCMIAQLSPLTDINVHATEMCDSGLSGHRGSISTLEKLIVFTSVGK